MAEMTASEAREILLNLSWAVGAERRSQIAALVEQQAQEIERLNKSLQFEQNYLSRVGTHADGCYKWGPGHWDCAVQEIERLQAENHKLRTCRTCKFVQADRCDLHNELIDNPLRDKCDKWQGVK